jgi:hypothetical protein
LNSTTSSWLSRDGMFCGVMAIAVPQTTEPYQSWVHPVAHKIHFSEKRSLRSAKRSKAVKFFHFSERLPAQRPNEYLR